MNLFALLRALLLVRRPSWWLRAAVLVWRGMPCHALPMHGEAGLREGRRAPGRPRSSKAPFVPPARCARNSIAAARSRRRRSIVRSFFCQRRSISIGAQDDRQPPLSIQDNAGAASVTSLPSCTSCRELDAMWPIKKGEILTSKSRGPAAVEGRFLDFRVRRKFVVGASGVSFPGGQGTDLVE